MQCSITFGTVEKMESWFYAFKYLVELYVAKIKN
jgi:hypothetical protein